MILKVFTQPNCPKCPAAKALARQFKMLASQDSYRIKNSELKIQNYDVSTVDGLAEASFYSVLTTPSLILTDDSGKEIAGWRGETPSLKAVLNKIK